MIETTIAHQLNNTILSTKHHTDLAVPPMLLPPAVDVVEPPRTQIKGNPFTTSNETHNLLSKPLLQLYCGPYKIQQT